MANGDAKAAIASEKVAIRKQKGKKLKEEIEIYQKGEGSEQLERQTLVSKPGKNRFNLEQYFLSGDTLQTTKDGKSKVYIGSKAQEKFERKRNR